MTKLLNKKLFIDKKDVEIARLKLLIKKFKAYDAERKQYYADSLRRLGELESYMDELQDRPDEDMAATIIKQRATISHLNHLKRVIQVHKIEDERTDKELKEVLSTDVAKRTINNLKKEKTALQRMIENLLCENEKLKKELTLLRKE